MGSVFGVEIIRPSKQYLKLAVVRATANAVVGEIYALQYGAGRRPVTHNVTDASTFESHVTPLEGTA